MALLVEAQQRIPQIIKQLRLATHGMPQPASALIVNTFGKHPFLILAGCILSLRTRDPVSYAASCRLFEYAKTPQEVLCLSLFHIERLIYPVGFYRRKAQQLHAISRMLIDIFNSTVPSTPQELLSLPGVGLKTTNLVLSEAFNIPAIVVDTHVHRLSNRLGLVKTKTPEQTEAQLKLIVPEKDWIEFTTLLIMWGQNICAPISPKCSVCILSPICPKNGVTYRR